MAYNNQNDIDKVRRKYGFKVENSQTKNTLTPKENFSLDKQNAVNSIRAKYGFISGYTPKKQLETTTDFKKTENNTNSLGTSFEGRSKPSAPKQNTFSTTPIPQKQLSTEDTQKLYDDKVQEIANLYAEAQKRNAQTEWNVHDLGGYGEELQKAIKEKNALEKQLNVGKAKDYYNSGKDVATKIKEATPEVDKLINEYVQLKYDSQVLANTSEGLTLGILRAKLSSDIMQRTGWSEKEFTEIAEQYEYIKNQEDAVKREAELTEYSKNNPVLASVWRTANNVASGLGAADILIQKLENRGTDKPIDTNSYLNTWANEAQIAEEAVLSTIDSDFGKAVYSTAMGMVDSMIMAGISAGVGGMFEAPKVAETVRALTTDLIMGSSVATREFKNNIEKGYNENEALMSAFLKGAIEGVTEAVSIEKILGEVKKGEKLWKMFLKSGATEAQEELASNWLGRVVDVVIDGGEELRNAYKENFDNAIADGKDKKEAFFSALWNTVGKEDLTTAFLSFLSGGVMGSGFTAVSRVPEGVSKVAEGASKLSDNVSALEEIRKNYGNYQRNDTNRNNMLSLVEEGKTFEEGSRAYNKANSLEDKMRSGKNISAMNIQSVINEYARARNNTENNVQNTRALTPTEASESGLNALNEINRNVSPALTQSATANIDNAAVAEVNRRLRPAEAQIMGTDGKVQNVTAHLFSDTKKREVYLSNGETRNVKDIVFNNDNERDAYFAAIDYDTETANAMIQGFSNTPKYIQAFEHFYRSGASGVTYDYGENALSNQINEIVARQAFALGRQNAMKQNGKGGTYFTRDYSSKVKLKANQKRQLAVIESYANKHKIRVSVVASYDGGKSNGVYDTKTDTIVIALDAKEGAYVAFASHELAHRLKVTDIDAYTEIRDKIETYLKNKKGYDLEGRIKEIQALYKRRANQELSREEALEEIVGNSLIPALSDRAFVENLAEENKGLLKKIREWIDEFIKELERITNELGKSYSEVGAVKEDIALMKDIRDIIDESLKKTNSKDLKGETKSSIKFNLNEDFASQVDDVLNNTYDTNNHVYMGNTPERLVQILGLEKLPMLVTNNHIYSMSVSEAKARAEGRYRRGVHYHGLGNVVYEIPKLLNKPILIIKSNTNPNSSEVVVIVDKLDNQGNPVMIAIKPYGKGNYYNVELSSNVMLSGYGKENFNNYLTTARNEGRILYAYKNKKISNQNTPGVYFPDNIMKADYSNNLTQYKTNVKYSVNNIISQNENKYSVNASDVTYSQQFKRWFGDWTKKGNRINKEFLTKDGKPKIFYHGTPNGDFTVFKEWQYFTENSSYADIYQNQGYKKTANAPKKYSVYLTADKVFDTRNPKERAIFEKKFYQKWGNGAPLSDRGLPDWTDGDDLIEFFEENGYDYDAIILDEGGTGGYGETVNDRGVSIVIKNPEQIKSATDNIGTFDKTNSDIRYSVDEPNLAEIETEVESKTEEMEKIRKVADSSFESLLTIKGLNPTAKQQERLDVFLKTERYLAMYDKTIAELTAKRDKELDGKKAAEISESLNKNYKKRAETEQLYNQRLAEPEIQELIKKSVNMQLKQLIEEYGSIKPGFNPVREIEVPKRTSPNKKVRQTVRTILESGAITDDMIPDISKEVLNETFSYVPISDESAKAYAENYLEKHGYEAGMQDWEATLRGNKKIGKNDIALAEYLLQQAAKDGNIKDVLKLSAELSAEGTRAGQTAQAISLLKKLGSPEVQHLGELYYIQKAVDNINSDIEKRFKREIEKGKVQTVKINEDLAEQLLSTTDENEYNVIVDKIMADVAKQLPSNWVDKWNAWRYLAMLGNPKTHIRNLVGNAIFVPAVEAKNFVGALSEQLLGKKLDERTKAIKVADKYKEFAKNDFDKVAEYITEGSRYDESAGSKAERQIRNQKAVFKTKWLENVRKTNSKFLEKEDVWFIAYHYRRALSQYLQANHAVIEELSEGSAMLEKARNYAITEAQKATYRDVSAAAQALNKATNRSSGVKLALDAILPFRSTPINILKRGIEYSPMGLVKTVGYGFYRLRNKQKMITNEFIDGVSAGFVGTVAMAIGAWLFSEGVLQPAYDDEDEERFDELQGGQEYAFKLFGITYTFDWAAPMSIPFFLGAQFAQFMLDDGFEAKDIFNAISLITEPMFNLSMLDGLNDTIEAVSYADNKLSSLLINSLSSYLQQAIPTLFGQATRTLDSKTRSTYVDKNSAVPEEIQRFIQQVIGKVPGLSLLKEPSINAWGEEKKDHILVRILENFISPGYVERYKTDEIEAELSRLYENTEESSVFVDKGAKYFNVDNERKDLTAKEYTTYSVVRGQTSYEMLTDLFNLPEYDGLEDKQKVYVVEKAYDYANVIAKMSISDYDPTGTTYNWVSIANELYEKNGIPIEQYILFELYRDGSTKRSDTVEAIDKLNLTQNQKDALYKAKKFSEKTLDDTPWH